MTATSSTWQALHWALRKRAADAGVDGGEAVPVTAADEGGGKRAAERESDRHVIQKDATRMAVLYWYQSRRRIIASEYMAKIFLVRDAVVERRTGGAIVRIICKENPEMVKAGTVFAEAIVPQVQYCMTGANAVQN